MKGCSLCVGTEPRRSFLGPCPVPKTRDLHRRRVDLVLLKVIIVGLVMERRRSECSPEKWKPESTVPS